MSGLRAGLAGVTTVCNCNKVDQYDHPPVLSVYITQAFHPAKTSHSLYKGASMKRLSLFVVLSLGLSSVWAQIKPARN